MNLHKDKERLRHQRQVRLLDDVMKLVPRPLHDSASKVRKLCRLVLYYHYLQKVHDEIATTNSSDMPSLMMKGCKKFAKKNPVKSPHKPVKAHCETKQKSQRANIVYLKIDRSKSEEKNILNDPIEKDNGTQIISNSPESPLMINSEYKVPEIVVANEMDDSSATIESNPCLPSIDVMQAHSNPSSSPGDFSLQSDFTTADNYNAGKENLSPSKTDFLMKSNGQLREQASVCDKTRILENNISEENAMLVKRRKTDFQNILQDYSNNSTLRDVIIPNAIHDNFFVTKVRYPVHDSKYVLEVHPYENISGYPINLSSGNVILTNNVNYRPLYHIDSTQAESQLHTLTSLPGSLSDNCSSSTLTDNMHIDVENFSDSSNEVCKIKAASSNDLNVNGNVYESPKTHIHESPKTHVSQSSKAHFYESPKTHLYESPKTHVSQSSKTHFYESPKTHFYESPKTHFYESPKAHFYESPQAHVSHSPKALVYDSPQTHIYDSPKTPVYHSPKTLVYNSPRALIYDFPYGALMNFDDYAIPYVSSSHNYLENFSEQNEMLSTPIGYLPHFDTIVPRKVFYNESPPVIQYIEPVHSFEDRLAEPQFINDNASFYTPSDCESFASERQLNLKLDTIKSEPDSQEAITSETKPRVFEDEVSYALSQYLNNY